MIDREQAGRHARDVFDTLWDKGDPWDIETTEITQRTHHRLIWLLGGPPRLRGTVRKLMPLGGHVKTIGIDGGANLGYSRQVYPDRPWLDCDLDRPHTLPVEPSGVRDSMIVCSDVVEHLRHPEHLLRSLRGAAAPAAVHSLNP